jgi:F-type H+-transporting ATPase subunit b
MEIVKDFFESFVGVNFWTMIFAWINLLILYLFLRKFLFKPVKKMIDSRQKEIDDMYSDAEKTRVEANSIKEEYEEKISHATEKSEEIIRSAIRKAELKEEEILRDAEAVASRTLKRAEEQIELEKKQALNEVKDEVSEMALSIARAVIERDIDEKDHSAFIDEFIDNMGE